MIDHVENCMYKAFVNLNIYIEIGIRLSFISNDGLRTMVKRCESGAPWRCILSPRTIRYNQGIRLRRIEVYRMPHTYHCRPRVHKNIKKTRWLVGSPPRPISFPRVDDKLFDIINFRPTSDHRFGASYVGKVRWPMYLK